MTRLEIKVQQPSADGSLQSAAMARVRQFADADGAMVKQRWQAEKALGIAGKDSESIAFTVFELPGGGGYEVTITLPRGQDISHDYEIEDGDTRQEIIPMEASPQEGLGWQQYAGIVRTIPPKPEGPRTSGRGPAAGTTDGGMLAHEQDPGQMELQEMEPGEWVIQHEVDRGEKADFGLTEYETLPPGRLDFHVGEDVLRGDDDDDEEDDDEEEEEEEEEDDQPLDPFDEGEWGEGFASITKWMTGKESDDMNFLHEHEAEGEDYRVWSPKAPDPMMGGMLVDSLRRGRSGSLSEFPRWSLYDPASSEAFLASIPWAWWGSKDPEGGSIQVVYDRVDREWVGARQRGRLIISVQDKHWFGLLEFLGSGRLIQAGGMIEEVIGGDLLKEALEDKIRRPLVAVAGAIILIARTPSAERQYWDRWLENLEAWFPGIPDGPILLGCRRAMQAENASERRSAFEHIDAGVKRGIPFFSASIRMMNLTLAQLGNDIPEADALRRELAPLCSAVDPAQPFTVLNF